MRLALTTNTFGTSDCKPGGYLEVQLVPWEQTDLKVRVIRQSDEIVEPDLDLYWAKASTALTVFRLLHAVGHFGQFSEIVTHSWRIQPSTRQYLT